MDSEPQTETLRTLRIQGPDSSPASHIMRRTEQFAIIAGALARATTESEVVGAAVRLAATVLDAETAGMWLCAPGNECLHLIEAVGYAPATLEHFRRIPVPAPFPTALSDVARTGVAVWFPTKASFMKAYPHLASAVVAREEYAVASLPLVIRDETVGVLTFSFEDKIALDREDQSFLESIAYCCAQALDRSRLTESERRARHELRLAHDRATFLLEASNVLGASMDYKETLNRVAELAVSRIADWCLVVIGDESSEFTSSVALAHVDPVKTQLASEYLTRFPPRMDAATGFGYVMRTGEPQMRERIDLQQIEQAGGATAADIAGRLGAKSSMIVPMGARGRTFGAITFVTAESGRHYTQADLQTALLLGRRAGMAIDNARLHTEAVEASRRREELLAIVSHDLLNPLQAAMLRGTMGIRLPDIKLTPEKARSMFEGINRSLNTMHRLIDDLVDDAGINAGKLALSRSTHTAAAIVHATVEAQQPSAEERKVELSTDVADGLPELECDLGRVLQVLANLVSNAIKVAGEGGRVVIATRAGESTEGCAEIVFSVHDTGPGVPESDLPHLFDRYWRGNNTSYRGLGLGLSIAKAIVEAHGGRIWAENGELGAVLSFTLPARK